jgi:hypothetical protein
MKVSRRYPLPRPIVQAKLASHIGSTGVSQRSFGARLFSATGAAWASSFVALAALFYTALSTISQSRLTEYHALQPYNAIAELQITAFQRLEWICENGAFPVNTRAFSEVRREPPFGLGSVSSERVPLRAMSAIRLLKDNADVMPMLLDSLESVTIDRASAETQCAHVARTAGERRQKTVEALNELQ